MSQFSSNDFPPQKEAGTVLSCCLTRAVHLARLRNEREELIKDLVMFVALGLPVEEESGSE